MLRRKKKDYPKVRVLTKVNLVRKSVVKEIDKLLATLITPAQARRLVGEVGQISVTGGNVNAHKGSKRKIKAYYNKFKRLPL